MNLSSSNEPEIYIWRVMIEASRDLETKIDRRGQKVRDGSQSRMKIDTSSRLERYSEK